MRSGDSFTSITSGSPKALSRSAILQLGAPGAQGRGAAGRCLEREGRRRAATANQRGDEERRRASAHENEHAPRRRGAVLAQSPPCRAAILRAMQRPALALLLAALAPALACAQSGTEPAAAALGAGLAAGGSPHPRLPGRRPVALACHRRALAGLPWRHRQRRRARHPQPFVDTSHWFDLTATAAFNTRSNARRDDMPELDYLFGVGRSWSTKGLADGGRRRRRSAHFKLRDQSTDFHRIASRGGTASAELRWREFGVTGAGSVLTASLEPTWAGRPLQRYFYPVDAGQATATRPATRARRLPGHGARPLAAPAHHARALVVRRRSQLNAMQGAANHAPARCSHRAAT